MYMEVFLYSCFISFLVWSGYKVLVFLIKNRNELINICRSND